MISNSAMWKARVQEIAVRLLEARTAGITLNDESDARVEQDIFMGYHMLQKIMQTNALDGSGLRMQDLRCTILDAPAIPEEEERALLSADYRDGFDFTDGPCQKIHVSLPFICDALSDSYFFCLYYEPHKTLHKLVGLYFTTREMHRKKMLFIGAANLVSLLGKSTLPDSPGMKQPRPVLPDTHR